MGTQGGGPVAHQRFEPSILLLEVLRPEEHPLQPDNTI
jgi:hypothetical protein